MAIDVQEAFEQSLVELGFDTLLDDAVGSPEAVEESEAEETPEAEESEEVLGESSEEDEDTEDNAEDEPVFEVSENSKLKLPDGTLVDAKQAVLLQSDYTKKTQELAEQRREVEAKQQELERSASEYQSAYSQMREWYETRAAQPSNWIAEIASQSQDATATVAQALFSMAQNGLLDPKFVETFGIDSGEIAEVAKGSQVAGELEELKRWRYEQENSARQQKAIQQRAVAYEQEWEQIKATNSLQFDDRLSEIEAKKNVLQFALQNNMTRSLVDAYDLMTVRKPNVFKKATPPVEASTKRASKVVSPKSSVVSNKSAKKPLTDSREATIQAMEELGL
jgi:hypothetical protein